MRVSLTLVGGVFLLLFQCSAAHLNMFLDQQEVRRLLGLTAELFYVREGVINEYALNFVVPVPATIQDLYFSWQAIGDKPVPYSFGIEMIGGESGAMGFPTLNISSKGNVPQRLQVFRLRFPCTGRFSSEVDVHLHLNVTMNAGRKSSSVTQLRFKRKKICLLDEVPVREAESMVTHGGTVYIAVGSASSFVIVLLFAFSIIFIRKRKAIIQETTYDVPTYCSNANVYLASNMGRGGGGSASSASYATIGSFQKLPLTPASSVFPTHRSIVAPGCHSNPLSTFSSTHNSDSIAKTSSDSPLLHNKEVPAYQVSGLDFIHNLQQKNFNATSSLVECSSKSPAINSRIGKSSASSIISVASGQDNVMSDPAERFKRLAVPRFRITMRNVLLEGTFGKCYAGLFLHPDTTREGQVLIKTVTEHASAAQKTVFLNEGTQMAGLQHRHILSVLGCCMDANNVPVIVYPWVSRGNLKRFLTTCRNGSADSTSTTELRTTIMTQDVVDMAIQAVLAMLYLHRHRVVHRDVAARSCVVDDRLRIKVTDIGLSRDLFPDDYHCLGDSENRPIKWMALESLNTNEFSTASDVWSFGVLLWELTTLAQQPYVEVDPFEMENYLRDDYRLSQPLNCPDELFAVMACCWIANPSKRPTFLQLLACLQDFHTALGRFI